MVSIHLTAFLLRLKDIGQLEAARQRVERRFPDLAVSCTSEVAEGQALPLPAAG